MNAGGWDVVVANVIEEARWGGPQKRIADADAARVGDDKLKALHAAALLAMAAQRLERPGSKFACRQRWLDRVWLPEAKGL